MPSYNIMLIGCGNMGGALLDSWHDSNLIQKAQIIDPSEQVSGIKGKNQVFHVKHLSEADFEGIDICILAVKPQIMNSVCNELTAHCDGSFAVLSIAAGKAISTFENILGDNTPIIRTMPNTPAMVGKGFTALIANKYVNDKQRQCATELFSASGIAQWVKDEGLMDVVTAVSGSGPAYLFYFIEALTNAGIENGLEAEMAASIARQTVIGASALIDSQNDIAPETLRQNVTSKGGTTQAGLDVLMEGGFQEILTNTIAAAKKRSEDLAN